jgi:hypothetical protein
MDSLDLSNPCTVLLPPPWKKRDLTVWALFFCPLHTLMTDTLQWVTIISCLHKSAATIKSLSMLMIESSKKLAVDTHRSGQFLRAQYRLWQIYRLAREYSFSADTKLHIKAAEAAFARIRIHHIPPPPNPFVYSATTDWSDYFVQLGEPQEERAVAIKAAFYNQCDL